MSRFESKLVEEKFDLTSTKEDLKILLGTPSVSGWGKGQVIEMLFPKAGDSYTILKDERLSQALVSLTREGRKNRSTIISDDKNHIYNESLIQGNLVVSSYDLETKKFTAAILKSDTLVPIKKEDSYLMAYSYYDTLAVLAEVGKLGEEGQNVVEKIINSPSPKSSVETYSEVIKDLIKASAEGDSSVIDVKNINSISEEIAVSDLGKDNDVFPIEVNGSLFGKKEVSFFQTKKEEKSLDKLLGDLNFLIEEFSVRNEKELISKAAHEKKVIKDFVSKAARDLNDLGIVVSEELARRIFKVSNIIKARTAMLSSKTETERNEMILPTITGTFISPPGTGKTTEALVMAKVLGLPFHVIPCGPNTSEMDLIASQALVDNGARSTYTYTALVDAAREGGLVLIDECGEVLNPNVFTSLNNMLSDGLLTITVEGGGTETIHVHPECVVIFAGNIGDRLNNPLPDSIMSRAKQFNMVEVFEILSAQKMFDIYKKNPKCLERIDTLKKLGASEDKLKFVDETFFKLANCFYEYNNGLLEGMEKNSLRSISNSNYLSPRDYFEHLIPSVLEAYQSNGMDSLSELIINYCNDPHVGLYARYLGSGTYPDFIKLVEERLK